MAFCAICGAALTQESGFCGSCGKPIGAAVQAPVPAPQATSTRSAGIAGSGGLDSNLAGALAYVLGLFTGILFLVLEPYKNDRFVRFHAMQSVLLSAAFIVFSIAWRVAVGILMSISGWIALATVPLRLLISLGIFALWVYVIYQAYSKREYRIPFIGEIAAKHVG
jgi:uncharacterized membrane protein